MAELAKVNSSCCDDDLLEQIIPSTVGLSYVKSDGRFGVNQSAVFRKEFAEAMFQDAGSDPLSEAVSNYGSDSFYEAAAAANDFLNGDYVNDILNNSGTGDTDANNGVEGDGDYDPYQSIKKRKESGPITPFEFAAFIKEQSYDPSKFLENSKNKPKRVLQELDDFYRGGFLASLAGGICAFAGNVFGAIGGFFDIIGKVQGALSDALSLLGKIKNLGNPIQALLDALSVKALIETVKKAITGVLDGIINKVKSAIANFSPENIINNVETFINENVMKGIIKTKEKIMKFFSEENINKIKDKVTSLFDYAAGLFANPSLEEIQFLVSRFCGLLGGIENQIGQLKKPLDSFGENFNFTYGMLRTNSNYVTAQVVANGGQRPAPTTKRPASQPTTESLNEKWYRNKNIRPVSDEERRSVPDWETITSGNHPLIYMDPNARPVVHPKYGMGDNHWYGCDIDNRALLMRVLKQYDGPRITILSAYRSPEYNGFLRSIGKKAAKKSMHKTGMAFDLANPGGSYEKFYTDIFRIARENGFGGIGKYTNSNFVHIDLRKTNTSWGS